MGSPPSPTRSAAMRIVVTFGVVSLLGDIVYQGARAIVGPYLGTLGAGAATVGLVAGLGELAGYVVRLGAGYAADRTGRYWTLTIGGYALTVVAVPLLGWVGRVDLALALVVAERLGKAIRTPSRDTLIAAASTPIGRGTGFGVHEALDQVGAVAGPLLVAAVLAVRNDDYRFAFTVLTVPGVLLLGAVLWARRMFPTPHVMDPSGEPPEDGVVLPGSLRTYVAFTFFAALGLAPFPLIAFHLVDGAVLSDAMVPVVFAFAMGIDAVVAPVSGRWYDRSGVVSLALVPPLTALALLSFASSPAVVWIGAAVWGAVMAVQESTLRAVVADLVPSTRRATAFGIFNTAYGVALFAGALLLGVLYEVSLWWVAAVVVATEIVAAVLLIAVRHDLGARVEAARRS